MSLRFKPTPRNRLWLAVFATALFSADAVDAQRAPNAEGQDISGIWWVGTYSPRLMPEGGGELPFTAEGHTAYQKNMAGLKSGAIEDTARTLCTPDGVPRLLATPYPFEIIQTPGQVSIIYEMNHAIRLIDMKNPLPGDDKLSILPYFDGHSAGRWEGDTLVVETGGFNARTFLDAYGAPHTDEMHTTERVRRINGGKQLEDVVTVRDPKYYTRPFTARFVYDYQPELRLQDYVCGEPHRDLSRVRGVRGF
jgi:hypothetical protein